MARHRRDTEPSAPDEHRERVRPRIGGRGGAIEPERLPTFRESILSRLGPLGAKQHRPILRRLGTSGDNGHRPGGGRRINRGPHVREPKSHARRCLLKAHFVRLNGGGRKVAALHLAYIERDGVNQDGSPGQLYGRAEGFEREQLAAALPGEKRQFRFIVSPEDAGELDLHAFTHALMAQMESDLGRRLFWGAVDHWDTDNPHVHVVVRGVDAAGKDLTIDRDYIAAGLRWRAQEIATRELGPRPEHAIVSQKEREVSDERMTSLDRQLMALVGTDGLVSLGSAGRAGRPAPYLAARLETLSKMDLARRVSTTEWALTPGWADVLKELGERNDIIKRMNRAVGRGPQLRILLDAPADVVPFEGVVRRKGLHDEQTGDLFAIVETIAGVAQYVRLPAGTDVREGAIVRVSSDVERWVRPSDRALQELAGRSGGIYDPAAQRTALEQQAPRPDLPTPAELVEGNERRLTRLARYRLVERLPDGRWRIPPDLVSQLETREVSHPRRKLRVHQLAPPLREQVRAYGPTWLDRQPRPPEAPVTLAPFRADVLHALDERGRVIAALGLDPRTPAGELALLERERLAVGRRQAGLHGLPLAPDVPQKISGRLVACEQRADRHYVVIAADGGRLVVLRGSAQPAALQGRTVTATRTKDGRHDITPNDLSRGDSP